MLEKRVIPTLLIQGNDLVKTIKFKKPNYIGDPVNTVKIFNDKEVDELIIFDINASKKNTPPNYLLLEELASEAFMPLCYGGGLKDIGSIERVFKIGYEKISIGIKSLDSLKLIQSAAKVFGSQSIVATIDYNSKLFSKSMYVYDHSKSKSTSIELETISKLVQDSGAGEICLNCVFRDGTYSGFDTETIKKISSTLSIPIIASGGASSKNNLSTILASGADAAAAGSLFIYHGPHKAVLINYPKRDEIIKILNYE